MGSNQAKCYYAKMVATTYTRVAVYVGVVVALAAVVAASESAIRTERDVALIDNNADVGKGRILGQVSTTTLWSISVSTSTVFFTCASGHAPAVVCAGRRKKRRININENFHDNVNPEITGSMDNVEKEQEQELKKSEKLYGFTVWTAVTASSTVVVRTTNTASTVRVSFYCSAALLSANALCG